MGGVTTAFAEPHEIGEALSALFELHAARWRLEGEEGVLADPRVQAFHRAAAPALADAQRGYSYAIGSDFSVPKQSFGTLAFAHLLEACTEQGCTEFHFLRGEEAYKYQWGAEPIVTKRLTIRRR